MSTRTQILVRGIVQGVGFRPFVFLAARRRALKGRVLNSAAGAVIDVEGEPDLIDAFVEELRAHPPPLAEIDSLERSDALAPAHYGEFSIVGSRAGADKLAPVAADVATCGDCLRELWDPADRRYRYPFINCSHCGPRFTIVEGVPYDRTTTTMRDFPMCADCRREYENPVDRRFHAEPIACPRCGPRLSLRRAGAAGDNAGEKDIGGDAIDRARALLAGGAVLAVKGIGGFHLACDALDGAAVGRLRLRKRREAKPFALMAESVSMIRRYCRVSNSEEALLLSSRRPIVLLEKKSGCGLPESVAPGVKTLGFMLPYAPPQHLILSGLGGPLVMTSGNLSDEPIAYEDAEAVARLGEIADYFLLHDRRIHMRADDSVARISAGGEMILRRSRGHAPQPIAVPGGFAREILACGAQLKNTFCLARGRQAFISHHIGDLENFETYDAFARGIEHFKELFGLRPEVVAHDLHPDLLSTRYALAAEAKIKIGVQHHHAHVAACMAEHGVEGPVIGVAFDGLGYGEDGAIWGGEFLLAELSGYERRARFRYIPLAGGDAAVRNPWRPAFAYLRDALPGRVEDLSWWRPAGAEETAAQAAMLRSGFNTVPTSSCGRLFDAVASLAGVRHRAQYEAQAAIELEALAFEGVAAAYPFDVHARSVPWEIDFRPAIRGIVRDREAGAPAGLVSARFHNAVARAVIEVCRRMRRQEGLGKVCLAGGTFQNTYLLERVLGGLRSLGFTVFHPVRVPPNDGGIALGQAVVADARLRRGG